MARRMHLAQMKNLMKKMPEIAEIAPGDKPTKRLALSLVGGNGPRTVGRPKGLPKTGGRKKGVTNRISPDIRQTILERGKPLELLCDVARVVKIRVGPQAGPGTPEFVYPTLQDRIHAAETLLRKIAPDLKATEISGPEGQPVLPDAPVDDRQTARAILAVLAEGVLGRAKFSVMDTKSDLEPAPSQLALAEEGAAFGETSPSAPLPAASSSPPEIGERILIGAAGACIVLDGMDDEGRERWRIEASTGQIRGYTSGKDNAEARAAHLVSTGRLI